MFPQKIKELREQYGWTQEYVGKRVNVSSKTVGAWERGTRQPTIDALDQLATLYGVTTDYLLGKNQTPKWANEKDANDLAKFLKDNAGSMTYQGENLTEDEKEKLEIAMTQIFWKRHKHD